jgi:hypothetical protein
MIVCSSSIVSNRHNLTQTKHFTFMSVPALDDRQGLIPEESPSAEFAEFGWDFEPVPDVEELKSDLVGSSDAIASDNPAQLSDPAPPSVKQELFPRLRRSRRSPAGLPRDKALESFVIPDLPCWGVPAGRLVEQALIDIIGDPPHQNELNSIRELLSLPKPQRPERRSRRANLMTFERHRGTILFMLRQPQVANAVWSIVYSLRSKKWQRDQMLEHHFCLDQLTL